MGLREVALGEAGLRIHSAVLYKARRTSGLDKRDWKLSLVYPATVRFVTGLSNLAGQQVKSGQGQ